MTDSESPSEDRMGVRAVSTLAVLAARKIDFLANSLRRLEESVGKGELGVVGDIPVLRRGLVEAVRRLDWHYFVTGSELSNRRLNVNTRLQDLDRRAIWVELERMLNQELGQR